LFIPREVFAPALKESAAAVLFVHNHPSGDPTPSREDIEITSRLKHAGDLLGIRVLDHIIIGNGAYISLADRGEVVALLGGIMLSAGAGMTSTSGDRFACDSIRSANAVMSIILTITRQGAQMCHDIRGAQIV
jgi:hypothetical protein